MKKMFLFLFALAVSTLSTFAGGKNVDFCEKNIFLSCSYVRDRPISVPLNKAPMKMLTIHLMENNLTIPDSLIGYEMVITSESGDVFFSTTTISTEVIIPDIPEGSYQIEFIGENFCFLGMFTITS